VKISAVAGLSRNLAMRLKSAKVRIVAPIPGRDTIGIEVPNVYPATVRLSELLAAGDAARRKLQLPIFLGKDVAGRPLVEDLAEMPHLLVAGASGSGKSNCLQTLLASLCFTRSPEDVRFVLVDPKMVELAAYRDVPHLLAPPVTDPKKAAETLQWLCEHMDARYERFAEVGVRNLRAYNELSREELAEALGAEATEADLEPMPQIVLIIDEVSDLMLMAKNDVETAIARLSQKARAVGIHMVLATQRPSADVLTGIIKANLSCRIAFQVSSRVNSMVILDEPGAEELIGRGDMLYRSPRGQSLVRAQCTYVDDGEIKRMCGHLKKQGPPQYDTALTEGTAAPTITASTGKGGDDELFADAVECVLDTNRASATLLQRRFSIGYSRASRLLDAMEEAGIVGPHRGGRARKILVTPESWAASRIPAA
jgi:S-DNA-T family DNA segregation ATPase FtsK/SpoIIIE